MAHNSILLIEDERDAREALKEILEMEGFKVIAAENGQEGLKALQANQRPNLILLDLMMPVMNGWEFLEALQQQYQCGLATIPVIVVSAVADLSAAEQRYSCRVMNKPVNVQSLVSIARQHCQVC